MANIKSLTGKNEKNNLVYPDGLYLFFNENNRKTVRKDIRETCETGTIPEALQKILKDTGFLQLNKQVLQAKYKIEVK
jgi:hypothetical protein